MIYHVIFGSRVGKSVYFSFVFGKNDIIDIWYKCPDTNPSPLKENQKV